MKNQFQSFEDFLTFEYKKVVVNYDNYVVNLTLNNPEKYNAMDGELISELLIISLYLQVHEKGQKDYLKIKNIKDFEIRGIPYIEDFQEIRCILINANGKNFCSGADLNWLKEGLNKTYDENYSDSLNLVLLLENLYYLSIPIVTIAQGYVIGGGVGLLLVSDVVLITEDSKFGISEVKIGVVPAAIIKYLKLRFRDSDFRHILLSGDRFDAKQALTMGLANYIVSEQESQEKVHQVVSTLIKNAPYAVQNTKEILNHIQNLDFKTYSPYVADKIAKLRQGNESIKGIDAFLSKQKPEF